MKQLLSLETPVAKISVQINFSNINFLKPAHLVSIFITSVKFLLPLSLDSMTILKFATILTDTSRPPNMCYCGKNFDNSLEVAAHNAESHKD